MDLHAVATPFHMKGAAKKKKKKSHSDHHVKILILFIVSLFDVPTEPQDGNPRLLYRINVVKLQKLYCNFSRILPPTPEKPRQISPPVAQGL